MIVECPHCFGHVLPMANDTCPSCGKNTKESSVLSQTMTAITIHKGQSFPGACILCGQSTNRLHKLSRTAEKGGESGLSRFLAGLIAGSAITLTMRGTQYTVAIDIPVCDRCKRQEIEPLHVDYDNFTMNLLVHKKFAEKLKEHKTKP